ncbi:serine hydrolase [Anoxynatronum buryatiense]|uniref:Beta-lactamase class A n=1 Tax=Anoxynatronum buryatiense TaxID=489973 RepID=A0AA46AIU4_9CLOT|nr:serine hydrolase [Anoxynatronum buryatiense]SMP54638.1 beta-lactamase class A [Anoxynatronum buryatiense]
MLTQQIHSLLQKTNAQVAVTVKDVSRGQWVMQLNDHQPMPSASIIKLLIMAEAMNQVAEGRFALDQSIEILPAEQVAYSLVTDLAAGSYQYQDLVQLMITVSDNTATNVLMDLLGMERINGLAAALGLKNTRLQRKMMDFESARQGRQNLTTSGDMVTLLELILQEKLATPALCRLMLTFLENQQDRDSLRRYLPKKVKVAHKTGELPTLNHDVGLVSLSDQQYLIGVFVNEAVDNLEARRLIGHISRLVYHHMTAAAPALAVVAPTTAPIQLHPHFQSEMADEAISGMVVTRLRSMGGGWHHIRTDYGYEGYLHETQLVMDENRADRWQTLAGHLIMHPLADVMAGPKYQYHVIQTLTRGSRVQLTGRVSEDWSEVMLPAGETGWVRTAFISPMKPLLPPGTTPGGEEAAALRRKLMETALAYGGTQYRWGGRTSLGIDCSGLCSMAYLLNGLVIYRDAVMKEEYLKPIPMEAIQPADLIFFPGHIAMYLGEGKYIHSRASANGVVINSLNPGDSDYDGPLKESITGAGTIFR